MKTNNQHEILTQAYSTWGDKLLQHTDVLYEIQQKRYIRPITVQLSPTEACDSRCSFCSVRCRPQSNFLQFDRIKRLLCEFKQLGAKSLEITGGGNPLLYNDKDHHKNINDIIQYAASLDLDIGIITNAESLSRIDPELFSKINWIRISLIKLDEGKKPEDYDFCGYPYEKLGFSYIIHSALATYDRTFTSIQSFEKIAKLVKLHDGKIKFVRFAGDCLIKGNNVKIKEKYEYIINKNDEYKKFFLKTIESDDDPYDNGCYVGMIRPYVASSPDNDKNYYVYTCTSHVLPYRTYNLDYALCKIEDLLPTWERLNKNFKEFGYPYEVRRNQGKNWSKTCAQCYYKFNNKLLHTVATELPDKNFP